MKFWNWVKNESGRTLYLEGYIAQESWWDDEVSPKQFKEELEENEDDIIVWINSPGGDVFAAAQIYNMIKEYKGKVTVKIDGLAASAASVIAMSGDEVLMSPVAMMMVHNPATIVWGEETDMKKGIEMLSEVKESIINAYEQKTGLSRNKISHMMDRETWMSAKRALDLNFCDRILYSEDDAVLSDAVTNGFIFDKATVTNSLASKLSKTKSSQPAKGQTFNDKSKTKADQLFKRLELLK
ncbi:head maturation protease, ClpP-related [Proteinivorax tanatarense]|uniref:ATP-dependent Clp protease proteolytic subunit n=2 Tax=Proteinivorax tanatarense TaxID=1260629 RepID=A0AAU7VHL4_9FIRM